MKRNTFLSILLAAIIGGAIAIGGYKTIENETPAYNSIQGRQEMLMQQVSAPYSETVPLDLDFTGISQKAVNSVVYIQSKYGSTSANQSFHFRQGPMMSTGSGVIISDDGYIVTNNHVVENAEEISVTLENNKNYTAIGSFAHPKYFRKFTSLTTKSPIEAFKNKPA